MKIEVTACDIDKVTPATTYTIMRDGETFELDLCGEDAKPIEDLIARAQGGGDEVPSPRSERSSQSSPTRRPAARKGAVSAPERKPDRRRKARVTSMEEIERQKREQQG
ncbi:hypothetical protein [Streptomyces sp. NPDC054849]